MQRKIILTAIAILFVYFVGKDFLFFRWGEASLTEFQLAADRCTAAEIVSDWGPAKVDEKKWLIRMDYVLLILFSFLLAGMSAERMNFEHNPALNNLFRLSIPLSFFAGLFDIAENILTTHNLNYPERFSYVGYLTIIKFSLLGWVVATLTMAWLRRWRKTGHFWPS